MQSAETKVVPATIDKIGEACASVSASKARIDEAYTSVSGAATRTKTMVEELDEKIAAFNNQFLEMNKAFVKYVERNPAALQQLAIVA